MTATALALAVGFLVPNSIASHGVTRFLLAWNVGAILYVLLAAAMMIRSTSHQMRRRAQLQDDGKIVILVLATLSAVASLVAIAAELTVVKDMHGYLKTAHIALAGVTVLSSWAFIQVMFSLHYAHEYYAAVCHGRPVARILTTVSSSTSPPSSARPGRLPTYRSSQNPCDGSGRSIASSRTCSTPQCSRC
jgi:uncharacterized membrane protein